MCREGTCTFSDTLYGVLYTPAWVFLCLFSSKAVVGLEVELADVSTHVFVCGWQVYLNRPIRMLADMARFGE